MMNKAFTPPPPQLEGLRNLMACLGDTPSKLARALGLNASTLKRKLNEQDGASLTAPEMSAIADYYDVPITERVALFFGTS